MSFLLVSISFCANNNRTISVFSLRTAIVNAVTLNFKCKLHKSFDFSIP